MTSETLIKDRRTPLVDHGEPADATAIVTYHERVSGESDFLAFGPGEFGSTAAEEATFIAGLERGRFGFVLKGTVDGQIVSVCTVMRARRPRLAHAGEFGISVARSSWGLGVGRAMTLAMLRVAREVGITKVHLAVREDNAKAIHVYESVGFRREGLSPNAFKLGDRYFADVRMGICVD